MSTDAEVRWIPVREVGEVRMGKQLSPSSREAAGQFPYLRVANVLLGRIDYSDVNSMGFSSGERRIYGLKPGDILLNEGQSLDLVGRSAIYEGSEGEYCFQNTLVRFRPGGEVLSAYAQIIFERWLATGAFAANAKQTTSIAHLGGDRFGALLFPLRSLSEQRRIVEVVDAMAAQERVIEASIVKLGKLRQGMLQGVFPERGSTRWPMSPLETVARVAGGLTLGGLAAGAGTVEVPYLRVANVQSEHISTDDMKLVRVTPSDVQRFRLAPGDVLLTEGGDLDKLGRGGVWDGRIDPCLHQNHIFRVRCCLEFLVPEFLALYLASQEGRAYFLRVAKQTTNLASVSSSQVKAMPVPCPPVSEQRRVVSLLSDQEKSVRAERQELAKLRHLRLGVVSDLLGGNS
ncbi:restriction endonuclease subunit S [Streptomyces sp. NPDC048389]|uniref:restriction endonuclease subunit S n=1 Tax=Streptomyces sp. NPDC048389 TaxID=3154622 RepID=UPI00345284ED